MKNPDDTKEWMLKLFLFDMSSPLSGILLMTASHAMPPPFLRQLAGGGGTRRKEIMVDEKIPKGKGINIFLSFTFLVEVSRSPRVAIDACASA